MYDVGFWMWVKGFRYVGGPSAHSVVIVPYVVYSSDNL